MEYLTTKVHKRIRLRVVFGCETWSFARNTDWVHENRLLKRMFGSKITSHRNGGNYIMRNFMYSFKQILESKKRGKIRKSCRTNGNTRTDLDCAT